jgi:hypothetical protein
VIWSAAAGGGAWKVLASLLLLGRLPWADPLDRQQRQAEVADLGEQAVQGRLVDDRPGDQGLAGRIAADLEAVEPAGPGGCRYRLQCAATDSARRMGPSVRVPHG